MFGHRSKGHRLSRSKSRRMFSRVAQYVHPVNVHQSAMRGGFRL